MTGYESKRAAAQDKLAQPALEPVADALIRQYITALVANKPDDAANATKAMVDYVYTTPPAAAQPVQERNFCERCGKRTADLTVIHTCTPPQDNK
jgi:hypothetical protein